MAWQLNPFDIQFLIGGIISIICGFLIGIERENRGKPAGISTNIFVILGAMLFTMISILIEPQSGGRVAANVVTGIGFLGAGLILKNEKGSISGLTTAASIWFSAAIGMAIGFGWYFVAIICTLASIGIPRIPHFRPEHEDTPENGSKKPRILKAKV